MKFKLLNNNINSNKNNKKTREKSRGRSMVEMLGVLAIIGVLSIGGISGYTIAIRKHKANEILNMAKKYATLVYVGCQNAKMNSQNYKSSNFDASYLNYSILENVIVETCPIPISFDKSGLGGLPNGALRITETNSLIFSSYRGGYYLVGGHNIKNGYFDNYSYNPDDESTDQEELFPVYVVAQNGHHYKLISIRFETQELCETAKNIIGREDYTSWSGEYGAYGDCSPSWENNFWLVYPVEVN